MSIIKWSQRKPLKTVSRFWNASIFIRENNHNNNDLKDKSNIIWILSPLIFIYINCTWYLSFLKNQIKFEFSIFNDFLFWSKIDPILPLENCSMIVFFLLVMMERYLFSGDNFSLPLKDLWCHCLSWFGSF